MVDDKPNIIEVMDALGLPTPGRTYGGWIPVQCGFHDDHDCSASVHPDEGAFKCHACGVHGDVYTLVMEHTDLPFPEAKRQADSMGTAAPVSHVGRRKRRAYTPPGRRGRKARA